MKKLVLILAVVCIGFGGVYSSCSSDAERIVDCLTEQINLKLSHSLDSQNQKKSLYTVRYTGSLSLNNTIQWDFGDGQKATLSGTTAEHIFTAAGKYTVKAKVTLNKGNSSCTTTLETTVTIP